MFSDLKPTVKSLLRRMFIFSSSHMFPYRITNEAFEYFHHLESASHRKAWTSVIVLILTKLMKLDDQRVFTFKTFFTSKNFFVWLTNRK